MTGQRGFSLGAAAASIATFALWGVVVLTTTSALAQPPNDDCAGAIDITGMTTVQVDTTMANNPATIPDDSNCVGTFLGELTNDVWYQWTAPASGLLTLTTCTPGGGFDTSIAVYSGDCASLNDRACNGDGPTDAACQDFQSVVDSMLVISGTTYLIQVGGWDAASSGVVTLELTFTVAALPPQIPSVTLFDLMSGELVLLLPQDTPTLAVTLDGTLIDTLDDLPAGEHLNVAFIFPEPLAPGQHSFCFTAITPGGTDTACCTLFVNSCDVTSGSTLSQITAEAPLVPIQCASCNDGFFHDENSYYRAFDLTNFGVSSPIVWECFDIEINEATAATTEGQPVRVRVHVDANGGAPDLANMTLIYEEEFQISDLADETLHLVPGTGLADPDVLGVAIPEVPTLNPGETLVIEFFTPDGQTAGNQIFLRRFENFTEATAGSYIRAPGCAINDPVEVSTLVPGDRYWISANFTTVPDCNNNGVNDNTEIAGDPSLDCNMNGELDSCEIAAQPFFDINQNGILDTCSAEPQAIFIGQGDWFEPLNWAKQVVPGPSEEVLLAGITTLVIPTTAASVELLGAIEFFGGATLTVDGFAAGPTAALTVEVGGLAAPATRVIVNGSALLDGQLRIEPSKAGAIAPCDVEVVLTASTVDGEFSEVLGGAGGASNLLYDVVISATSAEIVWSDAPVVCEFPDVDDASGFSVAIDGTVAVVGGRNGVFVHRWDGTGWTAEQTLSIPNLQSGGSTRVTVDIDGDVIVVGAPVNSSVYVFRFDQQTWTLEQTLFQPDATPLFGFPIPSSGLGFSVSVSGDVIVASSLEFDTILVWPFRFDGTTWSVDPFPLVGDEASAVVAVEGDHIFCAFSQQFGSGGGVRYYRALRWNGSAWVVSFEDFFPFGGTGVDSVAISGDTVVTARRGFDALIFRRSGDTWFHAQTLPQIPGGNFGSSVAIHDSRLAVGAASGDECVLDAGSVHLYARLGTSFWNPTPFAALCASDAAGGANFGISAALSSELALVGQGSYTSGSTYAFGLSADSDCDGVSDSCAILSGVENDCNGNLISDSIDIANGVLIDADQNGIADICDSAFFVRGDSTGDGVAGLSDVLQLLNYLFLSGSLGCADAADSTDDGALGLSDALHTLNYLFTNGPPIPPPTTCGADPTPETSLGCDEPCLQR